MKKLIVLSLSTGLLVGCTTTKIDDHSYRYTNIVGSQRPPVNNVTNNYHYNSNPQKTPEDFYPQDEGFLQWYDPEVNAVPSSYRSRRTYVCPPNFRGLHIRSEYNNRRTVVPARWDIPNTPSIPSGNAGIPVFCY